MRLSEVCSSQLGYTLRGRLPEAGAAGVPAIQLGDLALEGSDVPVTLSRLLLDDIAPRYLVRSGDVLFRSRGERNTASTLGARFAGPAVALSPIIILRPQRDQVESGYLAWAINQLPAQRQFDQIARGTRLRMVPKSGLDALELDIPDLETQRMIVAIDRLAEREQALSVLAAEKRKQLTSRLLAERARATADGGGRKRKAP